MNIRWTGILAVFSMLFVLNGARAESTQSDGVFPHKRTDLPKKKNATAGKYLYVGIAPRFAAEDLDMVSSKIGLTLRVTGRVTQEFKDHYALELYRRFKKIADAFQSDPALGFYPLQGMEQLQKRTKLGSVKLWLKVTAPYLKHVLENQGVEINGIDDTGAAIAAADYNRDVLTALLRFYLQNQTLTLESIPTLDTYFQNEDYVRRLSADLWNVHLAKRYTAEASIGAKGKAYVGFLTYVYPIAATTEGPFDQPREGVRDFGLEGNVESRIWSEKWKDEFGGMPFLLIEWSGVAYHGPITNYNPLDIWYLRRDYVSHGCHRMDSSDIMELRSIMPADLSLLQKKKRPIRHVTINWPDVTDWNRDGKLEVMDVDYYEIPTWFPEPKKGTDLDVLSKKYMGEVAQTAWRKKHYVRFNKNKDAATAVYDPVTGLYSGIPKYVVTGKKLTRDGVYDPVPVQVFTVEPSRIIQYFDGRPMPKTFDNFSGKYAPPFFVR
ncbi:MAG: hypothetical protein JST80_01750 [Bdellovibrionales bacterium]|nr:hypothetical protein [Bdellovibrionales bacterium]